MGTQVFPCCRPPSTSFRRSPEDLSDDRIAAAMSCALTVLCRCLTRDRRSCRHQAEHRCLAAVAALALTFGAPVRAQPAKPLDYQVKAVYLLNFGRFVTWPPGDQAADAATFSVCVLGQDPFGQTLDATVAAESIDGKSVVTRRIARPEESDGCRMLFVSASEDRQLPQIVRVLDKAPILTVSDMPGFLQRGGMIQFVSENKKVRFQISAVPTAAGRFRGRIRRQAAPCAGRSPGRSK